MTLRSDDRTIDGIRFLTTSIHALDGMVLWARLGKLAAPALSRMRSTDALKIVAVLQKLDKLEDLDVALAGDIFGAFGPALTELFAHLEPQTLVQISKQMLVSTTAICDGVKMELGGNETAIHAVLGDQVGTLLKLLVWVGRHNFKSFRFAPPASAGGAPAVSPSIPGT